MLILSLDSSFWNAPTAGTTLIGPRTLVEDSDRPGYSVLYLDGLSSRGSRVVVQQVPAPLTSATSCTLILQVRPNPQAVLIDVPLISFVSENRPTGLTISIINNNQLVVSQQSLGGVFIRATMPPSTAWRIITFTYNFQSGFCRLYLGGSEVATATVGQVLMDIDHSTIEIGRRFQGRVFGFKAYSYRRILGDVLSDVAPSNQIIGFSTVPPAPMATVIWSDTDNTFAASIDIPIGVVAEFTWTVDGVVSVPFTRVGGGGTRIIPREGAPIVVGLTSIVSTVTVFITIHTETK